jgi:hypothetical protein
MEKLIGLSCEFTGIQIQELAVIFILSCKVCIPICHTKQSGLMPFCTVYEFVQLLVLKRDDGSDFMQNHITEEAVKTSSHMYALFFPKNGFKFKFEFIMTVIYRVKFWNTTYIFFFQYSGPQCPIILLHLL